MDCAQRVKLLKEAKNYADVEKVLQEAKVGRSGLELARTAFQIREAQKPLSDHFLATVIKEMEDNEKAEKEYVGGDSHQASNRADPLKQEQKNTPDGANPDTGATGTENQMREDIMGMLDPSIANQMMPQSLPPMTMPQQIKQMQYTVQRMLAPLTNKVKELEAENTRLKEAITQMDTKLQETIANGNKSLPLSFERKTVKETTSMPLHIPTTQIPLEDRRFEISELDRQMKNGQIKPGSSIYS